MTAPTPTSTGPANDDSATDINLPDEGNCMSTDSSYSPSKSGSAPSADDFSADASDNLSAIYANQQLPPQPLHPESFDLLDLEIKLSQQAFLHFQQLEDHVSSTMPHRHAEFNRLLSSAVRSHQDPVSLEATITDWSAHHP